MTRIEQQKNIGANLAEMQDLANRLQILVAKEREKFDKTGLLLFYKINPYLIKIGEKQKEIKELLKEFYK